ncbi:MAG: hypothetical protein AAF959_06205, partial [Cyanobacteria bacterium P01_D01_bin.56]
VELAHFLINRDGNHQLASELLDKIPEEISKEEGFTEQDVEEYPTKYAQHVVFSRAVSHAVSKKPEKARDILAAYEGSFGNDLKFKYYLANLYFEVAASNSSADIDKLKTYGDAVDIYNEILVNGAGEFYKAQRNLGLSLYLKAAYSRESDDYEDAYSALRKALEFRETSEIDSENLDFLERIVAKAKACKSGECYQNEEQEIRNLVSGNSYYIIHEGTTDPFFDVEHDKFYCRSST